MKKKRTHMAHSGTPPEAIEFEPAGPTIGLRNGLCCVGYRQKNPELERNGGVGAPAGNRGPTVQPADGGEINEVQ